MLCYDNYMKKKIGISYTKTLFQNYWNWFGGDDSAARSGGKDDFELVELSFEKNNTEDIYQCDGFVLTGGVDVHPSFYNGKTDYDNSPDSFQLSRDRFEQKIYRYSQANNLPLLGICRGMQLVNVLQGGKLIQDLDGGNERHKKEESDKEHTIVARDGTLLHEVAGSSAGHVNSAHHQAIDPEAIGDNLLVNAHDDDDRATIEGLEFADKTGKGFMLCVQWHPERIKNKEANPFSENIRQQFLTAVSDSNMEKLAITNPATEKIIGEINVDNRQTLENKFSLLRKAQPAWSAVAPGQRVQVIKKL